MAYVVIYLIGLAVSAVVINKFSSGTDSQDRTMALGRMVMCVCWPIFLPITLVMWMGTEMENKKYERRAKEWRQKARGAK